MCLDLASYESARQGSLGTAAVLMQTHIRIHTSFISSCVALAQARSCCMVKACLQARENA